MNNCQKCGAATANAKYCSRGCSNSVTSSQYPKRKKTRGAVDCLACGAATMNPRFCCQPCQHAFQSRGKVEQWLSGEKTYETVKWFMRTWLLEKSNNACSRCGWDERNPLTGKSPLDIDHINGNRKDNRAENLRVLCPNCHSLTETYKALNSAPNRRRRSQKDDRSPV